MNNDLALEDIITARLSNLNPSKLEIIDESYKHIGHKGAAGGGRHYALSITSRRFNHLNPIQRHQLVYNLLEDLLKSKIHALSIKAIEDKTPLKIALTTGEAAGIGPDLIIQLCQTQQTNILIVYTDPNLLTQRAKLLNLKINLVIITQDQDSTNNYNNLIILPPGSVYVMPTIQNTQNITYTPCELTTTNALNTIKQIESATLACMNNLCAAIVTGPVQKSIINQAGINFTGHTEYIANLCSNHYQNKSDNQQFEPVMPLMGENIKVALITTHIPVKHIASNITEVKIINTTKIVYQELKTKFNIANPKILITGLNPHAGEDGTIGTEEIEIIIPAIKKLKQLHSIEIHGPVAADSAFTENNINNYDVIIAMYHDQGLTGFKTKCFNQAANVTLGLPIIRTSVDHGTALSLAGSGKTNIASLEFAIKTAVFLAEIRANS